MRNGLKICKPTSIAYSGTSASIVGQGSVEFSAVTSLSLNGVFSSDYDNYMISIRLDNSAGINDLRSRLRLSGTDATASNYTYQFLNASSTTVNAGRGTINNALVAFMASAGDYGISMYVYGPALAQPTAFRSVGMGESGGFLLGDRANTHSLSTAYDGITVYPSVNSMSGTVTVYGLVD